MPLQPGAIGIVLSQDRKVLLAKRCDLPIWVLPGGGIEEGESPQEALIREVKEETGIDVAIRRQCAYYTPINNLAAPTSVFLCTPLSDLITLSSETSDAAYFPLDKLPNSLFFLHANWLKESLATDTLIQRPLTEVNYFALIAYFLKHPWQVLRFAWTRMFK